MIKLIRFLLILFLAFSFCFWGWGKCTKEGGTLISEKQERLKEKVDSAKAYCVKNGLNTNYCFLVDFSIHSGKKRFFVWDFKGDSILCASLCAHGYGKNSTVSNPVFSNMEGSYCSSLGHYKVGARSYSKWGINVHYKLHGLEATNNNAFKRVVVLHSYDLIPAVEIYPAHLPLGMSQGCPVISNDVMRRVDKLLKDEKKAIIVVGVSVMMPFLCH